MYRLQIGNFKYYNTYQNKYKFEKRGRYSQYLKFVS